MSLDNKIANVKITFALHKEIKDKVLISILLYNKIIKFSQDLLIHI